MSTWGRDTPWRQGHVIGQDDGKALGLATGGDQFAVVVSHDCDLAQELGTEPSAEIIVGRHVQELDGNFTYAKNARRLQLPFHAGSSPAILELLAAQKQTVAKAELVAYKPIEEFQLASNEHRILQQWLAARYRRAAFPDAFDERLTETGLRKRLDLALKSSSSWIKAVLLDIDRGENVDHFGVDDPYTVSIHLLYSTDVDPAAALAAAESTRRAIEKAFRERCFLNNKQWRYFELVACDPISDEALTVRQSELLQRWNGDHVSLRTDPPDPMLIDN